MEQQDKAEEKKVFGNKENANVVKKVKEVPPKKYAAEDPWDPENFFYTKVINSVPHPLIKFFFNLTLDIDRVLERYTHLYPDIKKSELRTILSTEPTHFRWAGCDLFYTTEATRGSRSMVVIETNSCPSGQKSMPLLKEEDERGGYAVLMKKTFKPWLAKKTSQGKVPEGLLAVIYDKNPMEASGYALAMSQVMKENVYLVEVQDKGLDAEHKYVRWTNNNRILQIKAKEGGEWKTVRAAFRYLTQKPWNRMPVSGEKESDHPRTQFINPIVVDLAGGRNKLVAAKAYEFFNAKYKGEGLTIRVPETIRDVAKPAIPLWVKKFGGQAVVKVPYSNAGQGVYTILNEEELQKFMAIPSQYDEHIVQQCIGNSSWSSNSIFSNEHERYFHVGTIPTKKGNIYVADLRCMISYDFKSACYRPIALYARRAKDPLSKNIPENVDSWQMLGTNLSFKTEKGEWDTETTRLLLMDQKDFNTLGIGVDDLIDAFIQTVMSCVAIDDLATKLQPEDKPFDFELFKSLNKDKAFLKEISK